MTVFSCSSCGTPVTAELTEAPYLEPDPPETPGDVRPRVAPGTFTRDPEHFGPPYVSEPTGRYRVSAGPVLTVLVHPDDVRSLRLHPDLTRLNGCCRLDGLDGPNLVCEGCGAEIATEQNDCWVTWHDVRLEPAAVTEHGKAADDPARRPSESL